MNELANMIEFGDLLFQIFSHTSDSRILRLVQPLVVQDR